MHTPSRRTRIRTVRLGVGALVAGAAFVAVPAMASASTCTYDPAKLQATLVADSGPTPTTLKISTSGAIGFSTGAFAGTCTGAGLTATTSNTDKITMKGTIPAGFNHWIVPAQVFGGKEFEFDTTKEVEQFIFAGTGGDLVEVNGTEGNDVIHATGLFPIQVRESGVFDEKNDVDTDLTISTGTAPGKVIVNGLGGNDTISGQRDVLAVTQGGALTMPATSAPLVLHGGLGADTLTGGLFAGDSLTGDQGNDKLSVNDAKAGDVIDGGPDFDNGVMDADIDIDTGIEQLTTVKVAGKG